MTSLCLPFLGNCASGGLFYVLFRLFGRFWDHNSDWITEQKIRNYSLDIYDENKISLNPLGKVR